MGKIELRDRDTVADLEAAAKHSRDDAQKNRLRALVRVKQGATHSAVAEEFSVSRSSLVFWIKAYNEGGIGALKMSKGGRPEGNPRREKRVFEALAREIDKGDRYWSVPVMAGWIKEKYGKEIPENTLWYHVRHLDYSYKSARPRPEKGDAKKQEAFKRGASPERSRIHRSTSSTSPTSSGTAS